jgi:Flp pilus assembly protein TadG
MTNPTQLKRHSKTTTRRGAVIVLMVLLLPIALLMSAIAINLAYLELSRTEMIIATDAAARAGGRDLIASDSVKTARKRAKQLAALNPVAGDSLVLSDSDIEFGKSVRQSAGRYDFTVTSTNPNAVRVAAHRDSSNKNGPIPLLMPSILGTSSVSTTQEAISTQIEVDIGLVLDRSGSMAYAANEINGALPVPALAPPGWNWGDPVPPGSRWLDLVAAVNVFAGELTSSPGNELLSLSSYNNTAITNTSLTLNYATVVSALDIYTMNFTHGATNIGGGIAEGAGALVSSPAQRSGAAKVLIVLTDGIHNTGLDPLVAAQAAADAGIMIFAVTFSDEAEQTRMQQVAAIGNGRHYHATNSSQLSAVFRDIAASLPTLLTK